MPASLILGPSAHQTGPSPSHTCVGVHVKVWPEGMTLASKKKAIIASVSAAHIRQSGLFERIRKPCFDF